MLVETKVKVKSRESRKVEFVARNCDFPFICLLDMIRETKHFSFAEVYTRKNFLFGQLINSVSFCSRKVYIYNGLYT